MNDTTLIELSRPRARPPLLASTARRAVHARLAKLQAGSLALHEDGRVIRFGAQRTGPDVTLRVRDPAFYAEVALGGSVGAGESYMLGHWETDDLTGLLRLMLRNRSEMDAMERGIARLSAPLRLAAHALQRNTRAGSRRNIAAHYDLGNDFFRLFLDETLMYSCALFERPDMTLAEASIAKLDDICRQLELSPADHVLEIGTGWGGFAIHAARNFGCRVTTTTISPSQHEAAVERVRQAGLDDRITVLLRDYRDLEGTYDKLVSIEMIEAIGHAQYREFFRQGAARLRPGGRMLVQAITIEERHYERARAEVDFIKRYIFPGCCIPAVSALVGAAAAAGVLAPVGLKDIGLHYATTLARWRENFLANAAAIRAMGYPETFMRMWEFYLCYCEAGFAEKSLGDAQLVFERRA